MEYNPNNPVFRPITFDEAEKILPNEMWIYSCYGRIKQALDNVGNSIKRYEDLGEWVSFDDMHILPEVIADLIVLLNMYCIYDGVSHDVNKIVERRINGV